MLREYRLILTQYHSNIVLVSSTVAPFRKRMATIAETKDGSTGCVYFGDPARMSF